jgi:nucleoside-diphosphate-sugar epimerase
METVLVTGARGTVGHYVVGLAEAAGYRVVVNDTSTSGLSVPVRGEVRAGDLRDPSVCARVVAGCDHIIHTAAQLEARAESAELAKSNTDVVMQLYEAADAAKVKRFVHMSTAMLYAPGQRGALSETAEVAPRGPHGMSKHGAEAFLRGAQLRCRSCVDHPARCASVRATRSSLRVVPTRSRPDRTLGFSALAARHRWPAINSSARGRRRTRSNLHIASRRHCARDLQRGRR